MKIVKRCAQISPAALAFFASVALLALLISLLYWDSPGTASRAQGPLIVYCAAGLKLPVEAAARDYEAAHGVEIRLNYGGSQSLLSAIELARVGDLFLPADESYLDTTREKGLLAEVLPLAKFAPVLAVPKGNPKNIRVLADLWRENIRVVQANPDIAAVGKVTRQALRKAGVWDKIAPHIFADQPTVNDAANAIKVGTADAGFVWDTTVQQYPELAAVAVPELAHVASSLNVTVLRCSKQPTAALHFARYLAARDRGLIHFAAHGFTPVDGDAWDELPTLKLFAGAMLRPAIEKTIAVFEEREGAQVTTIYNGCGILVGQMRTGVSPPDAYFACDESFMTQVTDLFLDPVPVSTNQLVILVPRGNPHGIRSLRDLGKPGLRVGIGHEKQCALGVLTQETLRQSKTLQAVMNNVKVQTPTGDMLVNQLRTGSLDAVVAYISNATEAADELEPIAIDIPCALAVQPLAVARESSHKHLARRLVAALRSAESQKQFESSGFHWREKAP